MKAVILAGGFGTRISEETHLRPKPMIEIGGRPILWHLMKHYSSYGINDFIICCGYKGYMIKEYFSNYFLHSADVTFSLATNEMMVHNRQSEPWIVTLVDTGDNTMTGGRLKRVAKYLDDEDFCFTYGDGLSNVDVSHLISFHKSKNTLATMTGVQPPGRYGAIIRDGDYVESFVEKPRGDGGLINGGFFVLSPKVIELIEDDASIWEREPLETLSRSKLLSVFEHTGFWHAMDTLRDKTYLEDLWSTGNAPWKTWD
jgi:glucose-1-phosphate cytidylyltransferase